MRAVVQRVKRSSVTADGEDCGSIGHGLCVFVGVGKDDGEKDIDWLVGKVGGLRVFSDGEGKMNLNVCQAGGALLIVSQFTLFGDCRKGMRPSYDTAMPTDRARGIYEEFAVRCATIGVPVVTGVFQADMTVSIENDGPVTLLLDSKKLF